MTDHVLMCVLVDNASNRRKHPKHWAIVDSTPKLQGHYEGSVQGVCADCGALCWIGPEQQKVLSGPVVPIVLCWWCAGMAVLAGAATLSGLSDKVVKPPGQHRP